MPRAARRAPGGQVYHVLNRAAGKMPLFRKEADFEAFERVLVEAHRRHPIRILTYCVLSNHWHFVVWPEGDAQVTDFFRWLAHTHAMRWRVAHRTVGYGPLYQGRFKCFPVQCDEHLWTVLRYVERNALGAGLVARAEQWRWSGLWARLRGYEALKAILAPWPVERPVDWTKRVNAALSAKELRRVRESIKRSCRSRPETEPLSRPVLSHVGGCRVRPMRYVREVGAAGWRKARNPAGAFALRTLRLGLTDVREGMVA